MGANSIGDLVIRIVGDTLVFDSAIDKSEVKLKGLSQSAIKSLTDLSKSFENIDKNAAVFGKEVDVLGQKHAELRKQIETMLASGMKPEDAEIQKLKTQYDGLSKEIKANEDAQKKKEAAEKAATEQSKKHEEQLKKTLDAVNKFGMALSVMITAPVIAGFTAAIKGFADEEAAAKRLASAVDLAGIHTSGASDRLIEYAENIMKTTGVSHELIENLMSQAITMGRTEEEAKKLADASVDISARGLMPLESAFETLQVTYEGIGIRSKELRAITGELTEEQLKSGKAVDIVSAAVKGAGVEMRATTSGGMTALKNSADELGESFGAVLAPGVNKVVNVIIGFLDRLAAADDGTKTAIVTMLGMAAAIGPLILIIGKLSQAFTFLAANPYVAIAAGIVAVGIAITGAITKANVDNIERTATGFGRLATELGLTGKEAKDFSEKAAKTKIAIDNLEFATGHQMTTLAQLNSEINNVNQLYGLSRYEILKVILVSEKLSEATKKLAEQELAKEIQIKNNIEYTKALTMASEARVAAEKDAATKSLAASTGEEQAARKLEDARVRLNELVSQGLMTEKEAAEEKIKLREAEIDRLLKIYKETGNLSDKQKELIVLYRSYNAENQAQLDLIERATKDKEKETTVEIKETAAQLQIAKKFIADRQAMREVDSDEQKKIRDKESENNFKALTEQTAAEIQAAKKFISERQALREVDANEMKKIAEQIAKDNIEVIEQETEAELKAAREFIAEQKNLREVDSVEMEKLRKETAREIAIDELQVTTELTDEEIKKADAFIDSRRNLYEVDEKDQQALRDRELAKEKEWYADQLKITKKALVERSALRDVDYNEMRQISEREKKLVEKTNDDIVNKYRDMASAIASIMADVFSIIKAAFDNEAQAQEALVNTELRTRMDALDKEQAAIERANSQELAAQDRLLAQKYQAEDAAAATALSKRIAEIDARLQAELYAAGLATASTEEQYRKEIQAAIAAGDTEKQKDLQKALDKLLIVQKYEKEKADAEMAAQTAKEAREINRYNEQIAREEARYQKEQALATASAAEKTNLEREMQNKLLKIRYDAEHAAWLMQGIGIAFKTAMATLEMLLKGDAVGAALSVVTGALAGVLWNAAEPKYTPLASGGVATPIPGGRRITVAEAGEAEGILPLSKLDQMLARAGGRGYGDDTVTIPMTIKLDSKVLYSGIFQATKNKSVLINAGSVV